MQRVGERRIASHCASTGRECRRRPRTGRCELADSDEAESVFDCVLCMVDVRCRHACVVLSESQHRDRMCMAEA